MQYNTIQNTILISHVLSNDPYSILIYYYEFENHSVCLSVCVLCFYD